METVPIKSIYLVNYIISKLLTSLNYQTFSSVMGVHITNNVLFEPTFLDLIEYLNFMTILHIFLN